MNSTVTSSIAAEIDALPKALRAELDRFGFDPLLLQKWSASLQGPETVTERRVHRNRVAGSVSPPTEAEVTSLPPVGSDAYKALERRGAESIARGELAFVVMAGGMATRMGGVVKALVEVFPKRTFLDLRLAENRMAQQKWGTIPLFLMTSAATDAPIRDALSAATPGDHVRTFPQFSSLRLTNEGKLFRDEAGHPSSYATGHGDLVDALLRAKLLEAFKPKYVWITNLDNLGATVDPAMLGAFIERESPVLVEVCDKAPGDRGGIPARAEGRLQILEEFRLPPDFDPQTVTVFNTNSFLIRADKLLSSPFPWTYFEVEKKVSGMPAIQFERLLQEVTAHWDTKCLRVSRTGAESRFLPVKDHPELAARLPVIEEVLRARGIPV
ncbi:MAG: UTP--glucose-1-phosphate uridylyltransferase [Polyangiaceae bacterium]